MTLFIIGGNFFLFFTQVNSLTLKKLGVAPNSEYSLFSKLLINYRHVGNIMSSDETSYSKAMNSLATKVWEKEDDSSAPDSSQSRIEWIKRHIVKYFLESDRRRFQERL